MALGVKILYPAVTSTYSASAGFANYDAKYLTTTLVAAKVTLRIRARSYDNFGEATETPSVDYPITHLQLSNSPNFDTDRTLTLPYQELVQYDLVNMTNYDETSIPPGDITAITPATEDYIAQVMRITNWELDADEGPKAIYVRFITAAGTLPNPAGVYKGFRDDIIIVITDPSQPKTARVENETSNDYVPADSIFSWQESQDNIAGLRGYDVDLMIDGADSYVEPCSDVTDFDMERQDADAAFAAGDPTLRTRYSSSLLPSDLTFEKVVGEAKVRATFTNTSATPAGHEVQFENQIRQWSGNELNNFEIHLRGRPEFPDDPGSDGTFYAAIQTFSGLFSGAKSVRALAGELFVVPPLRARRDMLNVGAYVDLAWRDSSWPLAAKSHIIQSTITQQMTSFSLRDGAVDVVGRRVISFSGSDTPTDRSDGDYENAYLINASNIQTETSSMSQPITYWARVAESPNGTDGYTVVATGYNDQGTFFTNYSPTSVNGRGNAIQIAALYGNQYGTLTSSDLAKCHVRATLGYMHESHSADGTGRTASFNTISGTLGLPDVTYETTYADLSMAPIDPAGRVTAANMPYTSIETTSPSRSWNPSMTSFLTLVFSDIGTYLFPQYATDGSVDGYISVQPNAVLLEVWADPGLGHAVPELRIPYVAGLIGGTNSYSPTNPNGSMNSMVGYNLSRTPIYNPDGSISGYHSGEYSAGTFDRPPVPSWASFELIAHPLFMMYNAKATTHSLWALPAKATVLYASALDNISSIQTTATVTAPVTITSRHNLYAELTVTQNSGSGRRALDGAVIINHDFLMSSMRALPAETVVTGSGHSVHEITAAVDVFRPYKSQRAIPASTTVTGGTSAVRPLPAAAFVTAAWDTDPIYTDITNTHTVISGMASVWADYILVEFNKDGSYSLVRPTHDSGGVLTGYTRTILSTAADVQALGGRDVDLEVAYRENRLDVEEMSSITFDASMSMTIEDTTRVWNDDFTILWQKFTPTATDQTFSRVKIRVENTEPGGDLFHIQAIITPTNTSGLPDLTPNTFIPDQRTDIFGLLNGSLLKSVVWPDGNTFPTVDLTRHRVWSEIVNIPSGTSEVVLAVDGFTVSPNTLAEVSLTAGQDYMLGIVIMRVQHETADTAITFTSTTMDENFQYHPYRARVRWKTLNVPVDSALPERLVSLRAWNDAGVQPLWLNEFKSTEDPTNPALFEIYSNTDQVTITYTTFPENLQDDAELVVTYNDVTGSSVNRLTEVHTVSPLTATPLRVALMGMRGESMAVTDTASLTYDQLRYSDRSVIPNIDLSDGIGYAVESIVETSENIYIIGEQTSWTTADWGVNWSARYGVITGVSITYPNGDLIFSAPSGEPDGLLRSAEAHYLKPSQGKSFSISTRMSLIAHDLDTEFYVIILPSLYEANISEVQQVSDDTPQDFILIGFRYNGDIYLYRPDPNTGVVSADMIHTLGSISTYDWGAGDIQIRLTNATPGRTALSIWHGVALVYTNDAHREYTPQSDLGFWVGMGFRTTRDLIGQMRFDVGNIKIYRVSRDNPDTILSTLHTEHFGDIDISRWFVWPGVEELYAGGSNIICGIVNQNVAETYAVTHRLMAPSNVYAQAMWAAGVPDADTLDENGSPDHDRVRLAVSVDDVSSTPQIAQYSRWIGPSIISRYPITGLTLNDCIRIDFNYELSYPDLEGGSEVMFGIANWLPTNTIAANTSSGLNILAAEAYAAFNFTEIDDAVLGRRYNTRARANGLLSSGSISLVGLEDEQYLATKYPTFALISYTSDEKTKLIWGKQPGGTADAPTPVTSFIRDSFLPQHGIISLIIKPVSMGTEPTGDTDEVSVSLRLLKNGIEVSEITSGENITVSWQSQNATSVVSSGTNFGATQVSGSLTDQPTTTRYYNIQVQDEAGMSATASRQLTVNEPTITTPTGTLLLSPSNTDVATDLRLMAQWTSQNTTNITGSNIPGVTTLTLPNGSISFDAPATAGTYPYYVIVGDDAGHTKQLDAQLVLTNPGPIERQDPPTLNVSVPTSAAHGETITISYSVTNATSITSTPGGIGLSPVGGMVSWTPLPADQDPNHQTSSVYLSITATNEYGNANFSKSINITHTPSITVSPLSVAGVGVGQTIPITYAASEAAQGAWVGMDGYGFFSDSAGVHVGNAVQLPTTSGTYSYQPTTIGTHELQFYGRGDDLYNSFSGLYDLNADVKTVTVTVTHYDSNAPLSPTETRWFRSVTDSTGGSRGVEFLSSWRASQRIGATHYGTSGDGGIGPDSIEFTIGMTVTLIDNMNTADLTDVGFGTVGPPVWLPPTSATITAAELVLTGTKNNHYTGVISTYPVVSIYRLTSNPSISVNDIPYVPTDATPVISVTSTGTSVGSTLSLNILNLIREWVNTGLGVYGVLVDVDRPTESYQPAEFGLSDIGDSIEYGRHSFAGPAHTATNYRPYYRITYSGVSGLSYTANIPAGEVGTQSVHPLGGSSVRASATDPLYCDIKVRMNGVDYCEKLGVPFNFNSPDGTRFVAAARRKTPGGQFNVSATVSRFSLSCIDIRTIPVGGEASSLAIWTKTNGNLPSNTLFYGRNVDAFQEEDDTASLLSGGNAVVAQRFFAGESSLRAAALRVNATKSGTINAFVCACDSTGTPLRGVASDGHVDATDGTNILGAAYGRYVPGTKEAFFVFNRAVPLTVGNRYAILFDEISGTTGFNIYGTTQVSTQPRCSALRWDDDTSTWVDSNTVCCFRTFRDAYSNRENQHHGRSLLGRIASTNNADLMSEFSLPTDTVTADLLGPFDPTDPDLPPSLWVSGTVTPYADNDGFIVRLKIGAKDALLPTVVGSGVADFRIVYETDFGEMQPTAFKTWSDVDADGYITFDLYYGGQFLDTRRFYAEVRDLVGNVSKSTDLFVDFIYAYVQDTMPPSLVRVRIEGDASIDPDPDEAIATMLEDVNVSLYVVDEQTDCKDFRVNRNFAELSDGTNLLYEDYRPYLFQFRDTLTGADGVYALGVQARDYGDNATQPTWQHIERLNYENRTTVKEMPTAMASYAITTDASPLLMVGTTRRTARTNLTCLNRNVIGYVAYTVYEPWIGTARQTIKTNEEVTVRVNGITTTLYTVDRDNDWIVFTEAIDPDDVVTMDIVEEIAVLYRYDRVSKRAVKVFDTENERTISCLMAYGGLLYIGTSSGRIYAYNGIRTTLSLFRTTDGLGVPIPASCMAVAQFEADDVSFLYIGTYDSPHVFRYGGNPADADLGWTRLTTLCAAMTTDTDVYAIEMYEDVLWVATGPYGMVYGYSRTLDDDGELVETVSSSQLYADEFTADPAFRMNVLCLRDFDGRIYSGVSHKSSVFVYQLVRSDQPTAAEWDVKEEFDSNFQDSPVPWEYYNEGSVDFRINDRVTFTQLTDETTGEISDYYMELDGRAGEFCCWIDRSVTTGSLWAQVNNTTGWTMQFDLRLQTWGDPATSCPQGIIAYDGTYMVEFKLTSTAITIVSGEATESVPLSIETRDWHTYRMTVHDKTVNIYLDGDETPILQAIDFLEFETTGKALMFGKNYDTTGSNKARWRRLWYYLGGAVDPKSVVERDWTRSQVMPFGEEVRFLEVVSGNLIGGIQPRDPSDFDIHDDLSTLVPRTYMRPPGKLDVGSLDTIYGTRAASIVAATVHDDHLWTSIEVSDDPINNSPLALPAYVTEDPVSPMLKNGNVYERRLSQAFDTIIKDTKAPDAAIVINEDTSAGAVMVYAMESYVGTEQRTSGFIATHSPLGAEVGSANQVVDGDPDTYVSIGTNEVRYVAHDFGGDGQTTIELSKIIFGCRSTVRKTYRVDYLDPGDGLWKTILRMISDQQGDRNFFQYVFSPALSANGIRIYYTGDRTTADNDVELAVSAQDAGIGTAGYKLSRRQDMSDATSWTAMTDDTIRLNWALMEDSQSWETTNTGTTPYTTGIIFGSYMILASTDGYVHVSSDGTTFNTSSFTAGCHINAFAEYRDVLYLGTDDGLLYQSEDGIDWTHVLDTGQDRILSLATYNDKLYIGTGDNGKLYTWDESVLLNVKTFAVTGVSALYTQGSGSSSILHLGLAPTGQLFKYDGASYTQTIDLPVTGVNAFGPYEDVTFAACDKGRLYHYVTPEGGSPVWTMLLDSDRRDITGLVSHAKVGPAITQITSDGTGELRSGTFRYLITYVDYAGVESSAGESYEFDNISDTGRLKVTWQTIPSAQSYRVYRTVEANQGAGMERKIDIDDLTETTYYDDGIDVILGGQTYTAPDGSSATRANVSPPATSKATLWFTGDDTYAYTYDGTGLIQIALPIGATGANGVLSFRSQLYVFGQARAYTDAEIAAGNTDALAVAGKVIRWIATSVGSGEKAVYAKFIDAIGNETGVLSATIYYDTMLENRIVEVTPAGSIVTNYESQSDPMQKLYAPHKSLEQVGIYESQPFYASNISRWTVAEMMAQLPYDTEVRLYVRTGSTREECLEAEWIGPYSLENDNPDLYYYDDYQYRYSNIDYNWRYVDNGYYYYGAGVIETLSADISTLDGQWLQFRLELVTAEKDFSPTVFYVILRYQSTNAAMFYSTVFNLDDIAQRERTQDGGITARRGLITWNGTIPEGGDVRFGISTKVPETGEWSEYQEVTPNRTFEITEPGNVKVGIMLISTDTEVAIVDEWGFMLDTGDRDVRINIDE